MYPVCETKADANGDSFRLSFQVPVFCCKTAASNRGSIHSINAWNLAAARPITTFSINYLIFLGRPRIRVWGGLVPFPNHKLEVGPDKKLVNFFSVSSESVLPDIRAEDFGFGVSCDVGGQC